MEEIRKTSMATTEMYSFPDGMVTRTKKVLGAISFEFSTKFSQLM